ncbi:hypothetical protein [Actinobacillus equuli]|uniref:hypothetical protein n=1 Tax=Actinobacillus equuli TaxID=718 RepID=UPI002441B654|nr:hypothetical protein [Actinobacillus equuli]WGE53814.1 hypothetical protein NYR69_04445 [Actinobacillus equuli subsp. haemolyticus]WGE74253.1 hypothetical protein NYR80_04445 [Actinobacillus equuli subsp. haemolyticus]
MKKVTIGKAKNKKDYYDVGAYLNNTPEKSEAKIYVDDTHLTHGILLPGVNVFSQTSNSLCIFKAELHAWCDPNSELSQVEKDRLDPMFSAILAELDLDKDKPTEFKAGKLNQISLSPSQHRRMTGLIAKHDNEWKTTRIKDFEKMLALYRHHGKVEQASRLEKRIKDLAISLKVNQFDTEKQAYYMHPLGLVGWLATSSQDCIPLKEAKETALIISGMYEGEGGFASLSGNFDQMGMSWGIVQFNFGQNTLGPLLIDMRNKNRLLFDGCFSNNEDLFSLNKALSKGIYEQIKWAVNMQNKYNSRWKDIFNKLSKIREFQEIQVEHANKYIKVAIHIVHWMRGIHPSIMEKIEFKTFATMVDLAIQQGGIDKVKTIIKTKSLSYPPSTQYEFAKLVVEERGITAQTR